eukprot:6855243-Pyramimonas_sp.AAC.1
MGRDGAAKRAARGQQPRTRVVIDDKQRASSVAPLKDELTFRESRGLVASIVKSLVALPPGADVGE